MERGRSKTAREHRYICRDQLQIGFAKLAAEFLERPLLAAIVSLLPQQSRSPWERS
jgi:hypothetical protein